MILIRMGNVNAAVGVETATEVLNGLNGERAVIIIIIIIIMVSLNRAQQ